MIMYLRHRAGNSLRRKYFENQFRTVGLDPALLDTIPEDDWFAAGELAKFGIRAENMAEALQQVRHLTLFLGSEKATYAVAYVRATTRGERTR